MAFTREPVRASGVLRGCGKSAKCVVSALLVTLEGTRLSKDCQVSIEWVANPLPKGDYQLTFEDQTVPMRHSDDGWRAIAV
jgi:hypothetical protein